MEEKHVLTFCSHEIFFVNARNFCCKCGAIVQSINENPIAAIKPIKHWYNPETDPNDILTTLKTQGEVMESSWFNLFVNGNNTNTNIGGLIDKFKFKDKSYYLTICLLDTVVSRCGNEKLISTENIAVGCLVLSIKFTELDLAIPDLSYFQQIFDNLFFRIDEIKRYEIFCLKNLQYKLQFATPFDLIKNFIRNGIIFDDDKFYNSKSAENTKDSNTYNKPDKGPRVYEFLHEILEFTLQNINYLLHTPFHISCACIYLVREIIKIEKEFIWHPVLEIIYQIKFEEFQNTFDFVKSNYYAIRNSGDVICLYINNEPCEKKVKNLPPSGLKTKDTGKDLKIFEMKNIKLETITVLSNALKKDKINEINFSADRPGKCNRNSLKSQDTTVEHKNQYVTTDGSKFSSEQETKLSLSKDKIENENNLSMAMSTNTNCLGLPGFPSLPPTHTNINTDVNSLDRIDREKIPSLIPLHNTKNVTPDSKKYNIKFRISCPVESRNLFNLDEKNHDGVISGVFKDPIKKAKLLSNNKISSSNADRQTRYSHNVNIINNKIISRDVSAPKNTNNERKNDVISVPRFNKDNYTNNYLNMIKKSDGRKSEEPRIVTGANDFKKNSIKISNFQDSSRGITFKNTGNLVKCGSKNNKVCFNGAGKETSYKAMASEDNSNKSVKASDGSIRNSNLNSKKFKESIGKTLNKDRSNVDFNNQKNRFARRKTSILNAYVDKISLHKVGQAVQPKVSISNTSH